MKRRISLLGTVILVVAMFGASGPAAYARSYPGANGDIVFNGAANHTLFQIDPVTQVVTQLIHNDQALFLGGTYAADGQHIAFASTVSGHFQLWKMDADGTNVTQLTFGASLNKWPTWSPDGDHLAFVSTRNGGWDLYILDLVNGAIHRLTFHAATDSRPDWSPDGSEIAFESTRSGNRDIYTVEVVSHDLTRVTSGPAVDSSPSWSPDGDFIAFDSNRSGGFGVYMVTSDGKGTTPLVVRRGQSNVDPVFSPDGTMVAFASDRLLGHYNLYTVTVAPPYAVTALTGQVKTSYRSPDWQPIPV